MKYIDADKIRAEIDRLYGEYKDKFHQCGDQYHLGLIDGLDMAERVLDTLESEKPTQEGLDVTDFCKPIDPGIAQCIADNSWEMLGEDEKPIPNDLEEAADEYAEQNTKEEYHTDEGIIQTYGIAYEAFIAGAKWQKEQMLKEAVEEPDFPGFEEDKDMVVGRDYVPVDWVETLDLYGRWKIIPMMEAVEGEYGYFSNATKTILPDGKLNLKEGDKVRIIILPKEEEK